MISTWSDWKRYPRAGRGENIEAPITPGIYEVRFAATGALHSFGAVDNVAQALALLPIGSKSWFGTNRQQRQRLGDIINGAKRMQCAGRGKANFVNARSDRRFDIFA